MSYNEHLTAGLATLWDCTPKEAEDRVVLKRKRVSHDAVREEVPWTAARCNRLLRTITSRVNILRKQSKLSGSGSSARTSTPGSCDTSDLSVSDETPPPLRKQGRGSANDPEWVPGAKPKTTTRTYSGKAKTTVKPAVRKADSGFSTPFVKRLLTNGGSSTAKRPSDAGINDFNRPVKKMRQLPVQLASSNEEAQRNLVTAFGSMLTTTNAPSSPERRGAQSLRSMCLRRVPDYIDFETEAIHPDNTESEDITSSVYADLESLGTRSDGGWPGLREVVRAHSVHYIRAAIEEHLVHDTRIAELIDACSKSGALPEADCLLQSWLVRDRLSNTTRLQDSHPAVAKLAELRTSHDAREMYLRHHTELVDSDRVWISDVLRPGSLPLKDLIKALVRGSGQDIALALLESAVLKDCETMGPSALPIFTRLAGLLASIAFTQADDAELSVGLDLPSVIHRIAVLVAQYQYDRETHSGTLDPDSQSATQRRTAIHPFIMASTLLQFAALPTSATTISLPALSILPNILSIQPSFVKFACAVTHHIHRFSNAPELDSLLLTTSGLLNPPFSSSAEDRSALSRLAFEIAFTYAEQTGIEINSHFASGPARTSEQAAAQTPRRRVQVSGFKWEEGLCEWVAATPLALAQPAIKSTRATPQNTKLHASPEPPTSPPSTSTAPTPRPRQSTILLLPSSPDIIASHQPPSPQQARRLALQPRSANQQKPLPTPSQETKAAKKPAPSLMKPPPTAPKQVHLKLEREKKRAAAAAAAFSAAAAENSSKAFKRKASGSGQRRSVVVAAEDELGSLTPAKKRKRSVGVGLAVGGRRSLVERGRGREASVSLGLGGESEDELGL